VTRVKIVGPSEVVEAGPSAVVERPRRTAKEKGKGRADRTERDEVVDDESRTIRIRVLTEAVLRQREEVEIAKAKLEAVERLLEGA
jgi:hypothetical protein